MIDIWQIRRTLIHGINEVIGVPTTDPLTGLDYIYNQMREIFIMFACGACVAFLYSVYEGCISRTRESRRLRARLKAAALAEAEEAEGFDDEFSDEEDGDRKPKKSFQPHIPKGFFSAAYIFADILFCLTAGILILQFWYGSSYGRLSFHEFGGLFVGIWLGLKVFGFRKSKRMHTLAFVYVIILVISYILIL